VAAPAPSSERRAFGRIDLVEPLPGMLDDIPITVIEVSVSGVRVAHDTRIPPMPQRHIRFEIAGETLGFGCSIARSTLFRLARTPGEKSVYHTGIKLLDADGDSDRQLRDFIAGLIIRALEEQKANARGIPPIGGYTYEVEKSDRYRRCEFIDGRWKQTETTSTVQPPNGFTISASVAQRDVDLLRETFEATEEEGKRLTRMLAELSIDKSEGAPTRRYEP
jgi:hypothetical protein